MQSGPKFVVLSDLHVQSTQDEKHGGSTVFIDEPGASAIFDKCAEVVSQQVDRVDGLLVAGDMVNHSDMDAVAWTWEKIHALGRALDAPVFATAGNHDLDSRGLGAPYPHRALMKLDPPFPLGDRSSRMQYFAEHHAIAVTGETLVLSINSCASHGYQFKGNDEYEHGRVTSELAEWIEASLSEMGSLPRYRVVLLHHHLAQLPDFDTEEAAVVQGTELLTRVLSRFGDWFIIHGHKHRGWTYYSAGNGDAPAVLSASSFAANLGPGDFARWVHKQFHVVEFHTPDGPRGLVRTWNHDGVDWIAAGADHMLPGLSGFGFRTSIASLARRLHEATLLSGRLTSEEIDTLEPSLQYLTHDDRVRLLDYLRHDVAPVVATRHQDGTIEELQQLFPGGTP